MRDRKLVGAWTAVGVGVGVAIGAATHALALWTAIGVAVGALIGFALDRQDRNKDS
jgi:TPP-dependent 2-oxoacid decarboxylase